MRKILVFIDWFLPGYKAGGPVRSMANMVEHLNNDFSFYIVTRNTEYLETEPYTDVISNQWNDFAPNVKVFYTGNNNKSLRLWRKLIRSVKPDVVYINGIYSPYFSILPIRAAKLEKVDRIYVAPRGMLAASAIGVKSFRKKIFLAITRLLRIYDNIEWHTTNEKELRNVIETIGELSSVRIADNFPRKAELSFIPIDKAPMKLRLCSFARIAPEKNTLFALQSLLSVSGKVSVEFDLYGQIYDADYWQKCKNVIAQYSENIKVNYIGVINSDDVPGIINAYHALFLPSRGENFGHVILESFMAARPVIISDQTPWRNLNEKQAGWDLPLVETRFAKTIEQLAAMPQNEFNVLCQNALSIANEAVNNERLISTYKNMFKSWEVY